MAESLKITVYTAAEKIPDFSSWAIMNWLKFPASHVFIVYKSRMYHAVGRGICDDDFNEFLKTHNLVEGVTLDVPSDEQSFLAWYNRYKGIEYSDSQYLGFIVPFLRFLVRNKREKAVCSEFVSWFLFDFMGWKEFNEDSDFKTPKDVMEMLKGKVNGST